MEMTSGEFKKFLDNKDIKYNIEDGLFNILDSLSLSGLRLTKLPAFINSVKGNFDCSFNNLNSLKNAPKMVGGDFDCFSNQNLTSLEGAPGQVGRDFDCSNNNLTSLKGAPEQVGKNFYCSYNPNLTSLEGLGFVGSNIFCKDTKISGEERKRCVD